MTKTTQADYIEMMAQRHAKRTLEGADGLIDGVVYMDWRDAGYTSAEQAASDLVDAGAAVDPRVRPRAVEIVAARLLGVR